MSTTESPQAYRSKMDNLPVELVLHILQYLPVSSLIALKLSNRQLFSKTPSPPRDWWYTLSTCDKRAAWRHINQKRDIEYGRNRCVLCGVYAYENGLLPEAPICRGHEGRWMKTEIPGNMDMSLKNRIQHLSDTMRTTVWVSFYRMLCVHCKLVEGWVDEQQTCGCQCDSCGRWPVRCYVRVGSYCPEVSADLKKPISFKLSQDRTKVIETHRKFSESPFWAPSSVGEMYRATMPIIELPS